jgi:hypothetical protein
MAAEATGSSNRPRPWLLVALGIALAAAIVSYAGGGKSAAPAPPPSNPRTHARVKTPETVKPADLDVRLDELRQARPPAQASERNPFRFYTPPPPPVSGGGRGPIAPPPPPPPPPVEGPPVVPPPPPIPLKFIGVLEVPNMGRLAVFSDCRTTMRGKEGDIIDGRYRLVRIGVESVVMEYADGRGRMTIRESGQECVGK